MTKKGRQVFFASLNIPLSLEKILWAPMTAADGTAPKTPPVSLRTSRMSGLGLSECYGLKYIGIF